ncbi:MAG: PAS-domain containing protein, partial [Cypionkella sp.]
MSNDLINPADSPERQNEKLRVIAAVLMRRVEAITDDQGAAYTQFQRAALLEDQVRERTRELERALDLLNASNAALGQANAETESARRNLADALETVQEGFALFDPDDNLVMCNSRFGMYLNDLQDILRQGLRFVDYVDGVSTSAFFVLPAGESPQHWAAQRKRRHHERHVMFNVAMRGDAWVQVSEHRTREGGTVILQTDVTDIIRAEREQRGKLLDDQARVIRATLDHINQGVAIFDASASLVGWNRRLASLLALPLSRLRFGGGFEHLLARLTQDFSFGAGMDSQRLTAWVDGRQGRPELSFEVRRAGLVLMVFAQEMPESGFVMSFTDVTLEREAIAGLSRANETLEARVLARTLELEDALDVAERANASRTRFVAAASHDLLQPLSAAKLFLASIEDTAIPPETRATLDKAHNALVSVEGILDALLNISKLESGKAAVSAGPVPLGPMLAQLQEEFAEFAKAKGLQLIVRPSAVVVTSDPAYLRRILQNLIGNAIRYTARGMVLVGARLRGGMCRLEVWDTGPGIPEAEQSNIFKEFHRLNARASASEGMGLGLAIVERACALLGHPLDLQSRLGRGSCFVVQVPVSALGAPAAQAIIERPMQMQGRIGFLVENDDDLRRAMGLVLEKWGVDVLEAATGEEALALIEELGILPDFFLIDQQLGAGMSGLELIAALRQTEVTVPIMLVTADHSAELRARTLAAGVAMLMKPIDAQALRGVMAAFGLSAQDT